MQHHVRVREGGGRRTFGVRGRRMGVSEKWGTSCTFPDAPCPLHTSGARKAAVPAEDFTVSSSPSYMYDTPKSAT